MIYLLDNRNFKVISGFDNRCTKDEVLDICENIYQIDTKERYSVLDENQLLDEFLKHLEETGITYEGTGLSFDIKAAMFKEWIEESKITLT